MSTANDNKFSFLRAAGWMLLIILGAAVWILALQTREAAPVWRAFLVNFLFFTPMGAGMVVWSAVVVASRGKWMGAVEKYAVAGLAFSIPSIFALVILWLGNPAWSPWYQRSFHQGVWLDPTFIFARDLFALVCFWGAAFWYYFSRRKTRSILQGGVLIVIYAVTFSLIGFDLVMALDPQWTSSLFGGYFFISGLYIAVTTWTLTSILLSRPRVARLHDLGKLIFAFCILTTYMMYSQLLPIYYENLPSETRFLVPRMNYMPWQAVSIFLLVMIYLGPIALLLTQWAKKHAWYLGLIAGLILISMWIERWWLVAPVFQSEIHLGLPEAAIFAAFLGVFALGIELFLWKMPLDFYPMSEEK
ncbi:MAG: hypothetical protein WAN36_03530 [Calditrichia bacterium]